MRINLPITKRRIRNHFHYSFWKYLLLIAIAFFGWNLIFTTTRYRPPENAKVEFVAEGYAMNSDAIQSLADEIHAAVLPEMEEVTATIVSFDNQYGDMQLVVWVSAAQGDVYLIDQARFKSIADSSGTLPLSPYVENGMLHVDGIDLAKGFSVDTETGVESLMGIPADSLVKLQDYGVATDNMVLCILANGGNDENSIRFLNYLLENMQTEPSTPDVADTADAAVPAQ